MTKTAAGEYLFVHYGYGTENQPQLSLLADGDKSFTLFDPRDQTFTLRFDTSQRHCGGWHDLASAISHPCPGGTKLPEQYDQCRHCQQKTGFNPAFYHATSVSEQQQARNQLPHLLYLAHFAPNVLKVGITWADRGIKRLLDQGARSGIIVKVYPNADIARQYEAKIARLDGIAETLQLRQKYHLLQKAYNADQGALELLAARERLIKEVGVTPEANDPLFLDPYYLGDNMLYPQHLADVSKTKSISGNCLGMIGSVLITAQEDMQFSLPLGGLTGYRCTLSYDEVKNESAPHQVSLF